MTLAGWNSSTTMTCTGCHGTDPAPAFTSVAGEPNYASAGGGVLRSNSHKTHAASGASSCDTCHTATVTTAGSAIKAGSSHLDRNIDVTFNTAKANAAWNPLAKTCSNITCHGGGSATWGDAASAGCKVCHNSLSATHGKHIGDLLDSGLVSFYNYTANRSAGSVYRFGCATCHPTDTAKHRNGTVDINIASNKAGAPYLTTLNSLVTTEAGGYTRGGANSFTCETVYCHSNGRTLALGAGDYRQTPNWYGGTFAGGNRCGGCHDNPPQYAGQSHYVAASSLGNNGTSPFKDSGHMIGIHFKNNSKGNQQSGFLGYSSSGSVAHGNPSLTTTISCYICHSGIVDSSRIDTYAMSGTTSKFRCGSCHTAGTRTPLQTGQIVNTALHMNGRKDVAFAPVTFNTKAQLANVANALGWTRHGTYKADDSYDSSDLSASTWDPATKTCLTACHVNQPSITWGAQLKCVSCHANQ
jgi:predicted CxxxxCH...CXXCH cytochrome family protein